MEKIEAVFLVVLLAIFAFGAIIAPDPARRVLAVLAAAIVAAGLGFGVYVAIWERRFEAKRRADAEAAFPPATGQRG